MGHDGTAAPRPHPEARAASAGLAGPAWQLVNGSSTRPHPTLDGGVMAYDAADGYVIWVGLGQTWNFSHGQWTDLTPNLTASPPPVSAEGLVYDAADGYVLLFGGVRSISANQTVESDETWSFAAGVWTNLTSSAGSPPPWQYAPTTAYDPSLGAVLDVPVVPNAGWSAANTTTWTFAHGVWSNITAQVGPEPSSREQASLAYDAADAEMIRFGGDSWPAGGGPTWAFSHGVWTNVSSAGAAGPLAVTGGSMVTVAGGHVLLIGGFLEGCSGWVYRGCQTNVTWIYEDGAWMNFSSRMAGAPPAGALFDAPMAWDSVDGYGVLFDGSATWLLGWNTSTPEILLTPSGPGVPAGDTLPFTVGEFGGTPPYNVTLCAAGSCTSIGPVPNPAVQPWDPSFATPGLWNVTATVQDANGSIDETNLSVVAALLTGPLTVGLAVMPNVGDVSFTSTIWLNVSGGAPPYLVELTAQGVGVNVSPNVPFQFTFDCVPLFVNSQGEGECDTFVSATVTDGLGEVAHVSAEVYVCTAAVPVSACGPKSGNGGGGVGGGGSQGPLSPLHLSDPTFVTGYGLFALAAVVAAFALSAHLRRDRREARELRRELERGIDSGVESEQGS
jgi:hypothetical protein